MARVSCRRRAGVIFAMLSGACGGDATGPEDAGACATEVVVDSALLRASTAVRADCLRIPAGAVIAVSAGQTYVLRARRWIVDGAARFVSAPFPLPELEAWTSGGPFCASAHASWEEAVSSGETTNRGVAGRDGPVVEVHYTEVVGGAGRLAMLSAELPGTPGGPGRELRCGCTAPSHASHVARAPDGPAGLPGALRSFEDVP